MKKLGFRSIVLLTINSIIGSGIFISPGAVVSKAGNKTPIIYLSAAIFAAVLAIVFASASKYVSKSGASYIYSKVAFGEKVGIYVGITRFIACCIAWGVMATGVVKTVITISGSDSNNFITVTVGFIILMIILFIINLCGSRIFAIINNISTIAKLLVLIVVIIAGFFVIFNTHVNHFNEINSLTNSSGSLLVPTMNSSIFIMSVIAAFYAFTGFESVASGSGDMEKPEKNLPKAIPLAILFIAIIYILIIIVGIMINPKNIIESHEVVGLVTIFNNSIIRNIILYGALISMFGINVASSFHSPRILEAIANEKQLPQWITKRTENNFPIRAFVITAIISIVIPMAFGYSMNSIIIISSISRFIQFLIVPIAVMVFFYNKNKEETLEKVNKNKITDVYFPIIGLVLTAVLLVKFDWIGMFTVVNSNGNHIPNLFAILSMVIGYVILPILAIIYQNFCNNIPKKDKD